MQNKKLSEIRIAYIEASILKHSAEIIGPQIEILVRDSLFKKKSISGTIAIAATALAVRTTIENIIKKKLYSDISRHKDTKYKKYNEKTSW